MTPPFLRKDGECAGLSFNLNLAKGHAYTLPIFTLGKFFLEGERTLLPVALQVHHGVCDGFHTCRFLNELQALLDGIE